MAINNGQNKITIVHLNSREAQFRNVGPDGPAISDMSRGWR